MKTKNVDNQNVTKLLYVFNIGCLSHPKKTTSSCFLGNCRLLSINYGNKSCIE